MTFKIILWLIQGAILVGIVYWFFRNDDNNGGKPGFT